MRKKITLVLTAMFVAMFLTACSTNITAKEYKQLENVAFEVKNAEGEYQLPNGYEVKYTDHTKRNQITIIKEPLTGKGDNIKATFDITKDEPELISIQQDFKDYMVLRMLFAIFVTAFIFLSLMMARAK